MVCCKTDSPATPPSVDAVPADRRLSVRSPGGSYRYGRTTGEGGQASGVGSGPSRGRSPGAGDRVTRGRFGPWRRDAAFSPPFCSTWGDLSPARTTPDRSERPGDGGGVPFAAAGGQGHPQKCGRPPQDRVPPRLAGHAWTGSPPVWPPGSPFADWPWPAAGGGQGRPKKAGRRRGGRVAPRPVDSLRLWHLLRVERDQPGGPRACREPACRCAMLVEGRGEARGGLGGGGEVTLRSVAPWGGDGKALRPPRGLLRLVIDRTGPGWGLAVVCC